MTNNNELMVSRADVASDKMMDSLTNAGAKFFCSMTDDGTRASKVAIYNAINNTEQALSDIIGQTIHVTDVVAHPIELVDEETGVINHTVRVVLVAEEGTFQAVSEGILSSLNKIFNSVGMPSWKDEPVAMKILQKKSSKNAMFKYLTIELL